MSPKSGIESETIVTPESTLSELHQKIDAGVKQAIERAIERHRQLGESIAISENGKVVIVPADRIPARFTEREIPEPNRP